MTQPPSAPPENNEYAYDRLRREANRILAATGLVDAASVNLVEPKPNIPADIAFPVFAAAKAANAGNPADFARRIAEAAQVPDGSLIGKVEAMGGFVNFAVDPAAFAGAVLNDALQGGEAFGTDKNVGAGQRVVVEFSSPNIARKMHVGHMRSTVIGHAIRNIFTALGYDVIADNHLGDWGTQFGSLLAAIDKWNLTPWDDPDPVGSLVKVYADFNKASEEDPALKDLARAWFLKLEGGDSWARQTWQRLIDITMVEFERTYQRLGVTFDTVHGESYFEPMLDDVVKEAVEKGVAKVEPGGAVAADFGDALPSCLLRKTDGATLYQTRDVATCLYRWREYRPARNIYVVGAEQTLHFQQVYEIVRRMGYTEIADRSVHIPFGAVTGVGGERFSMRKGTVIFLDEVLEEAVTRSKATIAEKIAEGKTELPADEIDAVAEMIGVGAVIYHDLYQGPERGIRFDWDKVISFDGNTALYIQYTHARCRSILRKAGVASPALTPRPPLPILGEGEKQGDATASPSPTREAGANWERGPGGEGGPSSLLTAPEEQTVLKQLSRLPHAIREAGEKYLPAVVAEWTYNLAREFARFYHEHPVLEAATPELREARLALVEAVAQGIQNGMALLGIDVPERM